MANVGLITLMNVYNYGGMLQCCALGKILSEIGETPSVIDWPMSFRQRLVRAIGGRPLVALAASRGRGRRLYAKANRFLSEQLSLSPPINTRAALRRLSTQYDTIIAGSDQIWNQSWYTPEYFLDFVAPGVRRIAYAACCGAALPIPEERRSRLAQDLKRFDRISVRNRMTRDFVRDLTGLEPAIVADPTVLYNWPSQPRPEGLPEHYILLYAMSGKVFHDRAEVCVGLARKLGLPLVAVVSDILSPWLSGFGDVSLVNPGVMEWVGAIQHADTVFTDSFHGTIFSILNRKPLWNYIGREHSFERLSEIAERYGTEVACGEASSVPESLDAQRVPSYYDRVERAIADHRAFSLNWLRDNLRRH